MALHSFYRTSVMLQHVHAHILTMEHLRIVGEYPPEYHSIAWNGSLTLKCFACNEDFEFLPAGSPGALSEITPIDRMIEHWVRMGPLGRMRVLKAMVGSADEVLSAGVGQVIRVLLAPPPSEVMAGNDGPPRATSWDKLMREEV